MKRPAFPARWAVPALLSAVLALGLAGCAGESAAPAAPAPAATAPAAALAAGWPDDSLRALLLPHWGASAWWATHGERALYYDGASGGQRRVQVLTTRGPEGWTVRTIEEGAGDTLHVLRARADRHGSAEAFARQGFTLPVEGPVPADALPFWLRQLAFREGLTGRLLVRPVPGELVGAGSGPLPLRLRVGRPDSVRFDGQAWATWPVTLDLGGEVLARAWYGRRYPNPLVRWETSGGGTRQLRALQETGPSAEGPLR